MFPVVLPADCWQTPIGASVAAHPVIRSARIIYRFMDDSSNVRAVGPRRILDQALSLDPLVRIRAAGSLRFPVSLSLPRAKPQFSSFLRLESLFAASRREVLQQFLRSLVELFLVFLLFFAEINRVLCSTYPNELLRSRVVHTKHESPDVNG
jgi:hypothetical protein